MKQVNIRTEKAAGVCKQMSKSIQENVKKSITSTGCKDYGAKYMHDEHMLADLEAALQAGGQNPMNNVYR